MMMMMMMMMMITTTTTTTFLIFNVFSQQLQEPITESAQVYNTQR
jgi:hypothetical protein